MKINKLLTIISLKSIIMPMLFISLIMHSSITIAQKQQNITEMYIVNDTDGYTNLREGSGTNYEIIQRVANKCIIMRNEHREIQNGWIPVVFYSFADSNETSGYIHKSHLQRLDNNYAAKLQATNFYDKGSNIQSDENQRYLLSFDTPDVFVVIDDIGQLVVYDMKNDEIVLCANIPVAFDVLQGDTLSFMGSYRDHCKLLFDVPERFVDPMYVHYKIYQKADGRYDYYTEIFPEPRKVSKETAETWIKLIRNGTDPFYALNQPHAIFAALFLAYCSGVDAWDVVDNMSWDGSSPLEFGDWIYMKEAYDRRKNK